MTSIIARLFAMRSSNHKTLAGAWAEACTAGGLSKAEAMRQLNQALGTNYRQNRLYEWIDGVYSPERPVRLYMLRQALPQILAGAGMTNNELSSEQIERLAEQLT